MQVPLATEERPSGKLLIDKPAALPKAAGCKQLNSMLLESDTTVKKAKVAWELRAVVCNGETASDDTGP